MQLFLCQPFFMRGVFYAAFFYAAFFYAAFFYAAIFYAAIFYAAIFYATFFYAAFFYAAFFYAAFFYAAFFYAAFFYADLFILAKIFINLFSCRVANIVNDVIHLHGRDTKSKFIAFQFDFTILQYDAFNRFRNHVLCSQANCVYYVDVHSNFHLH